jgi:hypothetical protein
MKTIFILGAGAPLMADFLDRAHDHMRLNSQGVLADEIEEDSLSTDYDPSAIRCPKCQ